jgi:hypothetical protein
MPIPVDFAKQFREERNAVLLCGDFQAMRALVFKWNGVWIPDDEIGEAAMHKSITAVPALPLEHRKKSYHWLIARGYQSEDDGELRDE